MDAGIVTTQLTPTSQATAALAKNASAGTDSVRTAARKAAEEFESVFLTTLLEGMFAGMKTDGPTGGGNSEKTYRSMMLGEYAKEIAGSGGLGIADHVYREILAVQESSRQ
ncbi:MAG: rod-binding protein [Hyphomicrobiales bacterium]|nr:rod-binding protein [Hyphomicrobiales bacterium]